MTAFTRQLETNLNEHWRPVVRYDSAHGHPHRDNLDRDERVVEKFWLSPAMSNKEIVRIAEQDLNDNATAYHDAFLERKP